MICLLPSLPSHRCIWRVWSLRQVLPPWHEPIILHVRLPFLQPGLCDVHSCSLLFRRSPWWASAFHLELGVNWMGAKLDVRQPESSSLNQPYLVASSGVGCVTKAFLELVNYRYLWATFSRKESLVGGSDSCFGGLASVCQRLTIHQSLTRFFNHCAWWIMLRTWLLVSKCVDPCTRDFNVIPLPIPK